LRAHDEKVIGILPNMERGLMSSPALTECGRELARRENKPGWAFQSECALEVTIDHDVAVITNVHFPEGDELDVGDSGFQSCFRTAVHQLSLPCVGCRPGEVTFPWPFKVAFNLPARP
jgi:hypothetical protein